MEVAMSEDHTLELPGLDAQNPLGFFAALGLLRVLDEHALQHGAPRPCLAFSSAGAPSAVMRAHVAREGLSEVILADAAAQARSVTLALAYDDEGQLCDPGADGATRDLKPSPASARELLQRAAASTRRDADLAAGFFSELVQDNAGNTKPTALHFTAGQQTFLAMVEDLRRGITAGDVDEALFGPWRTASPLPSLSWDASVARNYALRASNPSKEKRGSVPAANWLAVHALGLLPVLPKNGRLETTGVRGGWKDGAFAWPVWSAFATLPVVKSLLRQDPRRIGSTARAALGVEVVFESGILRSDQGGYGSFTPAQVVLASTR
jgi:hypothetical protein